MEISTRNSNFSQFSDYLRLKLEHEGTRIEFDVPNSGLKDFSLMLLDTVWDSVLKMKGKDDDDISRVKKMLSELIEELHNF